MEAGGFYGGPLRLPLRPLRDDKKRLIEDANAAAGFSGSTERDDQRVVSCIQDSSMRRSAMKHVVNIEAMRPDEDERSLRYAVRKRESEILRDTYFLIDPENSPSKNLKMGHTTVYPTGKTTGHAHDDMEEVYFVISGRGRMVIGNDEFPIQTGDALYVPFGEYHETYNTGIQPLKLLWVTCRVDRR